MAKLDDNISSNRNDFSKPVKEILAKRAGFLCSICKAVTVGPSFQSIVSVTNIGIAAHITAASPGGPRYNISLSSTERSDISNGIWLCSNHAALIDRDSETWTVLKLREVKREHEGYIAKAIGIPDQLSIKSRSETSSQFIFPVEYGFLNVKEITEPYKTFIAPIIQENDLNENSTLGVLMCSIAPIEAERKNNEHSWTVFVNENWLQWLLKGQAQGFQIGEELPSEQIFGQIPGWPDSFIEFLQAIVQTNAIFEWKRHPDGYPILYKKQRQGSSK